MKKIILSLLLLSAFCWQTDAQPNSLDNYIGHAITLTTIAGSTQQVNQPRDLDFKPNSNELWVCNYGSANGGTMVIVYNAGLANQSSQYRKDSHSDHFMPYPSAFAFGNDGKWACVNEIQNTNSASPTFMGPALWLGDTSIFAKVFQNNWVNGYPLGSHIDMLHQSPFSMGIAHDSAMAYWVMDGYNGNICKYDYVMDHGPGYDNHSAGKIWRYIDVPVTRVAGVPSHMILDKSSGWLYFIDGGAKKIKRMDTHSGSITGTLTVPSSAVEPLAGYWKVEGATVEVLDSLTSQPCGIDYYNGRIVVSDYTTGDIYLYNTSGTFALLDTIVTGHPGMMGVKVGPDGRIWCVNKLENKVYRLDAGLPAKDASLLSINAPAVENFIPSFYSPEFNLCDGTIAPGVTLSNTGTDTLTSVELNYTLDGGTATTYSWTGSLATGDTISIALPASAVANGSHLLAVTITNVNGTADDVDLNNTSNGSFRDLAPALPIPFTEDFASAAFPPAGWNYVHFNPNNKMTRVAIGGFGQSVGCMKMNNYSGSMNITGQKDYLMSPLLDMSSASAATWLRFNVAYAKRSTGSNDGLQVSATTDCGNTWSVIYTKSGTALATAAVAAGTFSPTASQWRTDSVNLAALSGQSDVELMFTASSTFGNNLYLDDIFIGDLVTGIPELASAPSFSVYPNPVAGDGLTIHVSGLKQDRSEIRIVNPLGQELMHSTMEIENHEMKINTTALPVGTYFVTLTADGQSFTTRFLKM